MNHQIFVNSFILLFLLPLASMAQDEMPDYIPVVSSSWWQIANEDYDAGKFSNKPAATEPTLREHQQVSDFTIYKAANGKWQLVSAVRSTNFPGSRHFLMRWEADQLTDKNWAEKGVFWTTHDAPVEAGYTEGILYAPHCVSDQDIFYMIHNSGGTAHLLQSKDGIQFSLYQKPDKSYILFPTGEAGRDLMLLDNRSRNGLWYVYYASMDRNRKYLEHRNFTDIYGRTAKEITGPWSDPFVVGMGTPDRPDSIESSRYDFVTAESPFVVYYKGYYYKFEQAMVVASKDPADFQGKPVVANLFPHFKYPEEWWPALAPEVIQDGDKWYIAYFVNHHEHPLKTLKMGGVFVAELSWIRTSE